MITGIDHIEIVVKDVPATAEFFAKLGFTEIRRTAHHGEAVEMRLPGENPIIFEFHTGFPAELPGLNHIAFRVDDANETAEDLERHGIGLIAPPKQMKSGRTVASFRDPMHMRWQISEGAPVAAEAAA